MWPALVGTAAAVVSIATWRATVAPGTPRPTPTTAEVDRSVAVRRFAMSTAAWVGYCGNGDLSAPDPEIRRILFVIHGNRRDACAYASYALDVVRDAREERSTLVVAPWFLTEADEEAQQPGALAWTDGGWKEGALSLDGSAGRESAVSSFAVLDALIDAVAGAGGLSAATDVIVVGHSAGGQFVHRFAVSTRVDLRPPASRLRFRFVIANPSSYLFLDDQRPHDGPFGPLRRSERERCPGYNDYKYGLEQTNDYVQPVGETALLTNYGRRRVVYMLGVEDVDPDDGSLDTSCAATLQGENRLARGLNFWSHLGAIYGSSVYDRHTLTLVPGTAHDGRAMLRSAQAAAVILPSEAGAP